MNTQIQNAALNEQPPNKNNLSEMHKHDAEQAVQKVRSKQTSGARVAEGKPAPRQKQRGGKQS